MRRWNRVRLVLIVLSVYLLVCGLAGGFIAEMTLHPGRRVLLPRDERQAQQITQGQNAELEDVEIQAGDGIRLAGWMARPRGWNHDVVIVLHGLGDNRMGMTGYAALLLHHGFGVLMPDARAHGASGGVLATYGLLERDDIRQWFEWAAQRLVVEIAFWYARWKYDLDLEQVMPDGAVAGSQVPVWLIHGRDDRNIPVRHSRQIARNNPRLTVWEVPGADHCGAISVSPQEFERRLVGWFEEHAQVPRHQFTI
jgi:pimeloyl-ACP methyl ester carboxylesterase